MSTIAVRMDWGRELIMVDDSFSFRGIDAMNVGKDYAIRVRSETQ